MQRERRGPLAAVAVLLVGLLAAGFVVLASASGPVRPVSDSTLSSSPKPLPTRSADVTAAPQSQPTPLVIPPGKTPAWVLSLWQAVVYLVIAAVVAVIVVLIVRIVRRVRLPHVESVEQDWERLKSERLAEAVDTGLARIDTGTATDAVVACWVALEQAAASAGVPRDPAETPAEFTVRVLGIGGISEPQLIRLGELYREARYSTHGSSEQARTEARAALLRLRDELAVATEASP
ncbi:DUF4129 domain-containing protein [Kribbella sp. NPDC048915]|uniref:DUF4129 domain-containing protein n=1 Tax=Kribbella sp. NPDC048915 TaxID=3155148 RepID=UPI0033E16C51